MPQVFGPYDYSPLPYSISGELGELDPTAFKALKKAPPATELKKTNWYMEGADVSYYVSNDGKTAYRHYYQANDGYGNKSESWVKVDLTKKAPLGPKIVDFCVNTWCPSTGYNWMEGKPKKDVPAAVQTLFDKWDQRPGKMHSASRSWQGLANYYVVFQEPAKNEPARIAVFDAKGKIIDQGEWKRDPRGYTTLTMKSAKT